MIPINFKQDVQRWFENIIKKLFPERSDIWININEVSGNGGTTITIGINDWEGPRMEIYISDIDDINPNAELNTMYCGCWYCCIPNKWAIGASVVSVIINWFSDILIHLYGSNASNGIFGGDAPGSI